jgi:hypothetical protein
MGQRLHEIARGAHILYGIGKPRVGCLDITALAGIGRGYLLSPSATSPGSQIQKKWTEVQKY